MANYKIVSHASAGLPLNVATTTWAIIWIMYNNLRKLKIA